MGCVSIKHIKSHYHKIQPHKRSVEASRGSISDDTFLIESLGYLYISSIGSGVYSNVISAKHMISKTYRAVKVIKKSKLITEHYSENCTLKESEILETVSHPHILNYYETLEDQNCFYVVTELCKGGNLSQGLYKKGKFSEKDVVYVMFQILQAVEFLHKEMVAHRDLKPDNILLEECDGYKVKIGDFGNATWFEKEHLMFGCYGSPSYIPPEVLDGGYNEKVDIWSCGIMTYVLLTGKLPYYGYDPLNIKIQVYSKPFQITEENSEGISEECKELLKKMLRIKPEERVSATEALSDVWFKNIQGDN
ncbi:hypothetical protein SteCoe_11006 [Stentor coeruleus]|uniref:Protein kinase domain-containing protein n=1 Tax=Stentor coeruleus TaxID=5963 RepID=A0A1R2CEE4_9CILI|nr:hypothetical protein SteCoe_11006 [Stentor coeruleus]